MPQQKIAQFGGMLPAWDDRVLPVNQAAFAQNCYLYSGGATGWRLPKLLRQLTNSAAAYAYRIPTESSSIAGANLVFLAQVNDGDSLQVGEETYTFRATPTLPYDVLLGANSAQSAQNLFIALTQGAADDGVVCALGTVPNPSIAKQSPYTGSPFVSNTIGTTVIGANQLILTQVTPAGTMNLADVALMPESTNAGAHFKAVLYNDNGNDAPSSVIAVGNQVTGCIAGTPVVSAFSSPPILQGGSTYWIGFILDTATTVANANNNGTLGALANNTYASGAPSPAPTLTQAQPTWQMWGDLTLITSTDPENVYETHSFGVGTLPVLALQAPSFGASYNLTAVSEGTAGVRLTWLASPLTTPTTPAVIFFSGGTNQSADTSIAGAATWLEFIDPDTNVLKSPVVDDKFQRYYFASPSTPPQYNTYDRIINHQPPWLLGVPAPGCAPGITATLGGNATTVGFATSSNPGASAPGANSLFLVPIKVTGAMQVNDVNFMPATTDATGDFTAVLYADNNGVPGDLLNIGVQVVGATAGTAVTSPFLVPTGLLTNLRYWIGFITNSAVQVQFADAGTTGVSVSNTYASGAPTPAPAMSTSKPDWQVWSDATTSAVLEARAYVYTWITAYGEEGPPSPPTTVTAWSNSQWAVSLFTPTPDEMGVTRNIKTARLYRTVSGTAGQTVFFFVAEFDITTATYIDIVDDSVIATNAQLPSTNWQPPPFDLQGITKMPNGMVAGFRANEIWFCEAYHPHAWPSQYVLTTEFPIVGLGVTGQTLVACTSKNPVTATGVNPTAMAQTDINMPEPCLSRGSIVSSDIGGVLYESLNGLIQVTAGNTASNITEQWITRERWRALTPSKNARAIRLATAYFCFGTVNGQDASVAQQGFTIDLSAVDQTSFSILPQPGGHRIGFNTLTAPNAQNVVNLLVDPWTGIGLIIQNGAIYQYDFSDPAPAVQPFLWRSKIFQQGSKHNFEVMRMFFDVPAGAVRPQGPRNEAEHIPLGPTMYAVVRVYADIRDPDNDAGAPQRPITYSPTDNVGETVLTLVTEREVRESGELLRIASGFKTEYWQWEIEGRVIVSNLQVATSVKELQKV